MMNRAEYEKNFIVIDPSVPTCLPVIWMMAAYNGLYACRVAYVAVLEKTLSALAYQIRPRSYRSCARCW